MKAADELAAVMAALMVNNFQQADLRKVEVEFRECAGNAAADIVGTWCDKTEVEPGDTVTVAVELQPFQGQGLMRVLRRIGVPKTVRPGRITIVLGGAREVEASERRLNPARFQPKSFTHLLTLLNSRRRNDMLYLQVLSPEIGAMVGDAPMPNLPSSVLTVLNSHRLAQGSMLTGKVVHEEAVPVGMVVNGGRTLRVRVKGQTRP